MRIIQKTVFVYMLWDDQVVSLGEMFTNFYLLYGQDNSAPYS